MREGIDRQGGGLRGQPKKYKPKAQKKDRKKKASVKRERRRKMWRMGKKQPKIKNR